MDIDDENHFEYALGFAIVAALGRSSRKTQQLLFEEATAGDDSLREGLATFLHEKHPKTSAQDQVGYVRGTLATRVRLGRTLR